MANIGIAPPDPTTEVGQFRFRAGDTQYTPVSAGRERGFQYATDIPTVTTLPVSIWDGPTLPGSAGWFREKRLGEPEPAVGTWPESTADVDLTGSSRFGYPGVPRLVGSGGTPAQTVIPTMKPGGDPQFAYWLNGNDFVTSSPVIDYRMFFPVNNAVMGRIFVDGEPISPRATLTNSRAGQGDTVRLTFSSIRKRRITIYGLGGQGGQFGGVAVLPGYTVTKPPSLKYTVAGIGDSYMNGYGEGAETVRETETYIWDVALALGAESIIQAGIGGTGIIEELENQPLSHFAGRVPDVLALAPDVLFIAGGRNDEVAGLQAALESLLASVASVPEVYVVPTASEYGQADVREAMRAGALAAGRPFLDVPIDSLPKISTDNVHPTFGAQRTLAAEILSAIPMVEGLGNYEKWSDVEIEALLLTNPSQLWAIYEGYLQLATSAALAAKQIKDYDLQINTEKRAEALRQIALMWRQRAQDDDSLAGLDDEFLIVPMGNSGDPIPELTIPQWGRKYTTGPLPPRPVSPQPTSGNLDGGTP